MPIYPYEYEFVPPIGDRYAEDPVEADPDGLQHPDPTIAARAFTELRRIQPRRFAFYRVLVHPTDGRQLMSVNHLGYQFNDGSVLISSPSGRALGNYNSIASAWRRLKLEDAPMWLVWLEPETPEFDIFAANESRRGKLSTSYVSIPFAAFGRQDARVRAAHIVAYLQSCVPGLDRLDVTFGLADSPETEDHVFCDKYGCLLAPGHPGKHRYSREPSPAIEDEPEPLDGEADSEPSSEETAAEPDGSEDVTEPSIGGDTTESSTSDNGDSQ